MRSRRAMSVTLLLLVSLLCAMQTSAQSYTIKGYDREWHNAAGQVIGYQYRSCDGQIDSWGVTTGAPTTNVKLDCGVIYQTAPGADPALPCVIYLVVTSPNGQTTTWYCNGKVAPGQPPFPSF